MKSQRRLSFWNPTIMWIYCSFLLMTLVHTAGTSQDQEKYAYTLHNQPDSRRNNDPRDMDPRTFRSGSEEEHSDYSPTGSTDPHLSTPTPVVTPPTSNTGRQSSNKRRSEVPLPLCPPKSDRSRHDSSPSKRKNVLIVSTLDGQISALDLDKDGEMFWSLSTEPGPMLSSTISDMDLDNRGQYIKLIPSLNGRLYKFNGEMVEPIHLDVDSLLGASLKMNENLVVTGGKESRTYGILIDTGEIVYECGIADCNNYQDGDQSDKDMLVVKRRTQTVRAHAPRNGEQKWNFSVSLHDVAYQPAPPNPCDNNEGMNADDNETADGDDGGHKRGTSGTSGRTVNGGDTYIDKDENFVLKAVVPEGVLCAARKQPDGSSDNPTIKWKRKFQSPIVDVWQVESGRLERINLFSKNHIPSRREPPAALLDDSEDDENDNPTLYIGKHNNQLYIQESDYISAEADAVLMSDYYAWQHGGPASSDPTNGGLASVNYPRVTWRPYLVSPSRTPVINHGGRKPEIPLLIASGKDDIKFDQSMDKGDAKVTALSITTNSGEYPYDAGYYLYSDKANIPSSNDDSENNITSVLPEQEMKSDDTETTVEFIYLGLWHWWKEVIFISLVTAIFMNVLITRPIIHEMRWDFQERCRELANNFQMQKVVKVQEVFVEVPVQTVPRTPSTAGTSNLSVTGPDFPTYDRQQSDFSSRYFSDFEPVQCLGRGGFGVVFESKNKYDDNRYAVKRITLPSSEDSKKKVMREVKLHAKLDHTNIVRYYSTWVETPPPGWQEEVDSKLIPAEDVASTGQLTFETTTASTETGRGSFSQREGESHFNTESSLSSYGWNNDPFGPKVGGNKNPLRLASAGGKAGGSSRLKTAKNPLRMSDPFSGDVDSSSSGWSSSWSNDTLWDQEQTGQAQQEDDSSEDSSSSESSEDSSHPLTRKEGSKSKPRNGSSKTCDITNDSDSFSIAFEDSTRDSLSPPKQNGGKKRSSLSAARSVGRNAWNEDDESTGGIVFKPDEDDEPSQRSGVLHPVSEERGESDSIAVKILDSDSEPLINNKEGKKNDDESTASESCRDALEWDQEEGAKQLDAGSSQEQQNISLAKKAKTYLYIVMQLCRKDTLRDWLRSTPIRVEAEVLRIFHQICVGVEYVHAQDLIHRDLKPSNIYFSHDGVIKIGDFGLVTGTASPQQAHQPQDVGEGEKTGFGCSDQLTDQVGTQLYMSPEQLSQQPYNHKVDVFSLGLIFLELLVPFSTQMERLQVLSRVKKFQFPPDLNDKDNMKTLLREMLSQNSEERPELSDILQLPWMQEYAEKPLFRTSKRELSLSLELAE